MAIERHHAPVELRAEGRRLTGLALPYNETAPTYRERFVVGSVHLAPTVPLNLDHDPERAIAWYPSGGLDLWSDLAGLQLRAELPPLPAADRALKEIRASTTRGLSVEFHAERESQKDGIRIIEAATVSGIAVVTQPAYEGAHVEARRRGPRRTWVRGGIVYGVEAVCNCLDGGCNTVSFRPTALRPAVNTDVLALTGRASSAIGSTAGGTMRLRDTAERLVVELTDAARDTASGRELEDLAKAGVRTYVRPIIDDAASEFEDIDGVRTYDRAVLKAILIKPILGEESRRENWQTIEINGEDDETPPRLQRRARLWL